MQSLLYHYENSKARKKSKKKLGFCIILPNSEKIVVVIIVFKGRTDLAVEDMEIGYVYEIDKKINGMFLKKCNVDKALSKKIGKDEGIYYNLDNIDYYNKDKEIIKITAGVINDLISTMKSVKDILVVGLGNPHITPDSLGPLVINKIEVNRHLEDEASYSVSAISPGVMGQTGMESSEIIKAIVDDFKPDLVIVVDALACSDPSRMCASIQLSTAGINPGAGIGNNRKKLAKDTLGCEVLAIGIPTVTDINVFTDEIENDYYVTPNNIDEAMDILSGIIARSINKALIS